MVGICNTTLQGGTISLLLAAFSFAITQPVALPGWDSPDVEQSSFSHLEQREFIVSHTVSSLSHPHFPLGSIRVRPALATTLHIMAYFVDGKDCMVSQNQCIVTTESIFPRKILILATDLRMDSSCCCLRFRRSPHLHAPVPPPPEARLVRLPTHRLCTRCAGSDHLRHAHVPDGRIG